MRSHLHGFAFRRPRVDHQALRFVLLTVAVTTLWAGLCAGLTARAVGLS